MPFKINNASFTTLQLLYKIFFQMLDFRNISPARDFFLTPCIYMIIQLYVHFLINSILIQSCTSRNYLMTSE